MLEGREKEKNKGAEPEQGSAQGRNALLGPLCRLGFLRGPRGQTTFAASSQSLGTQRENATARRKKLCHFPNRAQHHNVKSAVQSLHTGC